ncbi:MAG TPA: redoxin domain-containing protein [Actinobacteria bacterium]|nr:AhpC/TSA family protein [bacterium BMS3Bbin02]HDL42170.1 redoxin domain-containing protein [Actinomycetota bacterium]
MQPLLHRYGVATIAISKDSVEDAAAHKRRDNLSFALLSDPDLEVIGQYGLVHRAGFEFVTRFVFGLALGYPVGFKQMAIPTSLLIDESGTVRWIDQAEDYRLRGDESRIEHALREVWGDPEPE